MKYTVTSSDDLRLLCIKNNWFTCGSCEQYDKLFYANSHGATIEEIAAIIWVCSDVEYSKSSILSALEDSRKKFMSFFGV